MRHIQYSTSCTVKYLRVTWLKEKTTKGTSHHRGENSRGEWLLMSTVLNFKSNQYRRKLCIETEH
jgi:hypothetical protein